MALGAGCTPTALVLSRLVRSPLYAVEPNDPASLALAILLLAAVASLAGFLPARRAATSDPVSALRES